MQTLIEVKTWTDISVIRPEMTESISLMLSFYFDPRLTVNHWGELYELYRSPPPGGDQELRALSLSILNPPVRFTFWMFVASLNTPFCSACCQLVAPHRTLVRLSGTNYHPRKPKRLSCKSFVSSSRIKSLCLWERMGLPAVLLFPVRGKLQSLHCSVLIGPFSVSWNPL